MGFETMPPLERDLIAELSEKISTTVNTLRQWQRGQQLGLIKMTPLCESEANGIRALELQTDKILTEWGYPKK